MNKKKWPIKDIILNLCIWMAAIFTIGVLLWILVYILMHGLGKISFDFLIGTPREIKNAIWPMIVTTIYLVIITIIISTPIGICAAIYLVEYAKPGKIVNLIRFATESLAGIPSILYGLFGMIFFAIFDIGFSILSGGFTLSIMVLPNIIRTTEEALRAVPNGYREASLGLGVSKLRTILYVVLPSALPGILTAVILNIGRIVGESAAVYYTVGMVPEVPGSFLDSGRTLAVHMYLLASEMVDFDTAYATATVLIIIIIVINFIANMIGNLLDKK
ncbi:phosphate ABC transporter permease PstA [Garciella nitratireducens]|uniref:Phosphate transport system permease protein PstA n=1 Tax=Garciella nitratireducens DSM 15102 TaxID=1121911 RepID=A0A1T4K0S2_9FIRM|nr:phosphate ABC transporter permease PstA [Garciella nitratireducens]SJZ35907.1 phosphate ABC transporter membrane protein 2, PhoT family [Garciella nitratireducens DSM 15102]